MEEENETIQAETPDVEIQRVTENGDGEQEAESAGTEFQILSAKVDNLTTLMTQFFPLLEVKNLQEINEKKKSQNFKLNETPKKLPWDQKFRDPTFTELAGSMVYSSKDSSPKEYKRRETIFNEADILERNTQVPSYRKTIPPFKGELRSLRFSEVSRFFRELNSYQSEHNTLERGASHLAWSVRTQLTPPGISDDTFSQLSNKELFCIIRQEIRPTSQQEFRRAFVEDLKFFMKDNFVLQPSTYREWVGLVRVFFREVLARYDFLTEGLDPKLIPNVEDRETGLVSIILSKMLPYGTARCMHNEFFYEFKKRNRYYTLVDYVNAFEAKVELYIQAARDSLALSAAIGSQDDLPGSSPVYARKFEYAPKRFNSPNTEKYSSHNRTETKTVLFVENGNDELHNENSPHGEVSDPNGDIFNPNVEDIDGGNSGGKFDEEHEIQNERKELFAFVSDTKHPLKPLNKLVPPSMGNGGRIFAPGERRTKSEYPCYRYVMDGKCPYNENCNNSHDEGRCKEYYFTVIKKLQNESPFRPVAQNKQQVLALHEQQRSYVMSLSQNVDLVKVVFCTGVVHFKDSTIDIFKMLLDSGALHGNYISEEFLYEHHSKLFHIMEDVDELVILADASKTCQITKKIRLILTVNSGLEGVKDVTFSSFYSVLPGLKHDIIVGLPSLLCELIDLYVARILSAKTIRPMDTLASESIHSISTIAKAKGIPKSTKKKASQVSSSSSLSVPEVTPQPKRGPFLHDSINRGEGLKKKCRTKFIVHGDNKPMYPDGESEDELDERMLDATLPLTKRLANMKTAKTLVTEVVPMIAANKHSPQVLIREVTSAIFGSESDEFLSVASPQASDSYHRGDSDIADEGAVVTDLVTPDSTTETLPPMLSVVPFPAIYPFMRVPFTDCNDFREREVGFKIRLEEFRIFLSQTDHVKGSGWNRTEPFTLSQKNMLQECVHTEGTYCAVSTMVNLDEQYPRHTIGWDTVREFQYACTECRVKRWYMPLSRHRAHDCPHLQHNQLKTIYNVVAWSGVMGPPSMEHTNSEAISNSGLFMRCQLDKDPNTWMYWVRDPQSAFYYGAKSVEYRAREAAEFQLSLTYGDVTHMARTNTTYNPMLTETPIYKMSEATYSRIALAHAEVGCSAEILPTMLKLDVFFPGHTISFDGVLQFLRACSNCSLQCDHFVDRGLGHPYMQPEIVEKYGPTGTYMGKLPTVPETSENAAHYLHMLSSSSMANPNVDDDSQDIDLPMSASQHQALWYDHIPTPPNHSSLYMTNTQVPQAMDEIPQDLLKQVTPEDSLLNTFGYDILEPWSSELQDEEAPEESDAPAPASFDIPLSYMNQTIAEATLDFHKMIETRVSPVMTESTDVVRMLKGKYLGVFVPHNWTGITGIDPIVIEVTGDLPPFKKPRSRPINPKVLTRAHDEFKRLLGYFYAPSTSPWASCLVIAPKKTEPLIRFCGDYREMNKYICARHTPIPNVGNEILRISSFKIFADLDMKTSFHQLPLAVESRRLLSIQTIWGQVEPIFVPEGSKPASGALQDFVRLLFGHLDYVIAIFDNLLVLANDPQDLELKLYAVLDICLSHNVVLGFKKCNIGVTEVEFFGYICSHKEYKLSDARKASIMSLPFPRSQKEVQQVMGTANMFLRFTPDYATLAKDITDMSSKAFNWDESSWTVDHRGAFDRFKLAVANSLTLHYPDYSLNWILRTDASTTGCGVVLYQEYVAPGGIIQEQVIAVLSHKFSGAATRWPTIEQEAYAIFFGVKKLEFLLMCKKFVVETDHRNLVWMETSLVAKIIRWRIYLQAFDMSIKHIKGTDNGTADWLSRLHSVESDLSAVTMADVKTDLIGSELYTPRQCFERVHGGRMGHPGSVRTVKLLNKYFPSHGMSQETVANLVADCAHCQKIRIGIDTHLVPMHRTLSQGHLRAAIGCDTLAVSPTDDAGYKYIVVIVNLFSKYVALYPVKSHDALSLATSLFQYYCTYGICEQIVTDPGSDLTSEVIRHLHRFFGIRHIFSVVERHQSNGVEGSNKSILRHLRSIVHDERLIKQWSHPTVLPLIQYMLNCEHESSESGVIPLHAHFGNMDVVYQQLPTTLDPAHLHHEFVQVLADNITLVRSVAQQYQASIARDRSALLPETKRIQFQPGDFVLKRLEHRPSKLMFQLSGPYKVVSQEKNDVQVRSLVYDNILTFNLDHLKVFIGTEAEAKSMALLDKNQYLIKEVQAYRGDPANRSSCTFLVWFEDNDLVWLPYSLDISNTSQFEAFCSTRPELYTLLYSYVEAQKMIAAINRSPITEVQPGDTVFVDLRFYGAGWYNSLDLPSSDIIRYVVSFTYVRWYHKTSQTKIVAQCAIFKEEWPVNHHFVRAYGSARVPPENSQLVDSDLVHRFPHILPPMAK